MLAENYTEFRVWEDATMPAVVWAVKKEDQDLVAFLKEKNQSLMARPDSGPVLGLKKTEGLPQSM